MRYPRQAYTLMEVLLVMAILIIVSAVTIPTVSTMFAGSSLDAAADAIQAELTKARNKALEERRPYLFAIKEGTSFYRIAPASEEYWAGAGGIGFVNEADYDLRENPVSEGILPDKVCFCSPDGLGNMDGGGLEWSVVATFLPDGTAQENVQFGLSVDNQQIKLINLNASTGSVTTASLPVTVNSH